jgi:AmmeMemoRadiSam system protein B
MPAPAAIPALRRLRVQGLHRSGEPVVALHDPLGVADAGADWPVVVPSRVFEIARRFDGTSGAEQIAFGLRAWTHPPTADEIARVAAGFSEKLLLDDGRFRSAAAEALARWNELDARPCRDRAVLEASDADARFGLRMRVAGLVADDWDMPPPRELRALFAPGGSFERAGRLYGRVYAAARHAQPERVVLLSSAGAPLEPLLVPLSRPLATPIGTPRFDAEGLARLAIDAGASQLAHARHVALERHALFLALLLPRVPVLPLLVGALPARLPDAQDSPRGLPEVERALEALQRSIGDPSRTLVIACFELAHVDARAEQPLELGARTGELLRPYDQRAMDRATALDAEGFWRAGLALDDAWRAAQLSAPYLALRLLEARAQALEPGHALTGDVLGYLQSRGRDDLSSWVAAAFLERPLDA